MATEEAGELKRTTFMVSLISVLFLYCSVNRGPVTNYRLDSFFEFKLGIARESHSIPVLEIA